MKRQKQNYSHNGKNMHKDDRDEELAKLAEYEEFKLSILPAIQKALLEGATAKEIYKMFAPLAAARTVTIAAREVDSSKALAAAKDIMDRAEGKAAEKITHTHHYENLSDDELDAQIVSRAEESMSRKSDDNSDPDRLN